MNGFLRDGNEQEVADVLAYISGQASELEGRMDETSSEFDALLESSTLFLAERGISVNDTIDDVVENDPSDVVVIPSWDQLVEEPRRSQGTPPR